MWDIYLTLGLYNMKLTETLTVYVCMITWRNVVQSPSGAVVQHKGTVVLSLHFDNNPYIAP